MQVKQLELNLWDNLEEAAAAPAAANLDLLWQQLEEAIAPLDRQLQLACAAEGILKIAQIYALRSDWLLSSWQEAQNTEGPVLGEEVLAGLVRQTMTLDLEALIEPPAPERRTRRTNSGSGLSVAGTVDKAALLQVLEQMSADSASTTVDPLQVAHSEDISAWSEAISLWMQQSNSNAVSLLQLQQALGMPLIEVWMGLLLGEQEQYEWETGNTFYHDAWELWLRDVHSQI